jgi:polyisoprenoid-binding protein YceI
MINRLLFMLTLFTLSVTFIHASDWQLLPQKSTLNYIASYEGLEAPGEFKQFDVQLKFNPDALKESRLQVTVDLTSADMGSDEINEAIVGNEWLNVKQHALATYQSETIVKKGEDAYLAKGSLNLKGIEHPVEVPFAWQKDGSNASMHGELVVKRTRFNIGSGEWSDGSVIGLDVKVMFDVQLQEVK